VLLVPPGSDPAAVKVIFVDSTAEEFKLFAVGGVLIHVQVADCIHVLPSVSLNITRPVSTAGSFCVQNAYVLVLVHDEKFVPSVLRAYPLDVLNQTPASVVGLAVSVQVLDSVELLFGSEVVGPVVSIPTVLPVVVLFAERS